MHGDHGQAALQIGQQHAGAGIVVCQVLRRAEDDGMVRHHQLAAQSLGLSRHSLSRVQSDQELRHGLLPAADQKAHVVEVLLVFDGRQGPEIIENGLYGHE